MEPEPLYKLTLVDCFNVKTQNYTSAYIMLPYSNPTTVADMSKQEFKDRLQAVDPDLVPVWEGSRRCWS